MGLYKVRTEDLLAIRDQLSTQADLLASTRTAVGSTSAAMVQQIDDKVELTRTTVDALLAELTGILATTEAAAGNADWLGADADGFRAAHADVRAAIDRSRTGLETAVVDHRAATSRLSETIGSALAAFQTESGRAQELSGRLASAVGVEADSYEQAFNGGWAQRAGSPAAGADPGAGGPEPGAGGANPGGIREPGAGPAGPGGSLEKGLEKGQEGPEFDDWDGIGDPDEDWHRGKEWKYEHKTGTGKAPEDGLVDIKPVWETTLFEGRAEASTGRLAGEFGDEDGVNGAGELAGPQAGVDAEVKAGLDIKDGAFLVAATGASATLASAQGRLGFGPATAQARGFVGAEGNVEAKATIGPNGARAKVGGEAFVGAKAEAELSAEHGGVRAGVGGEVSYGFGAHAEVDASLTTDNIGLSVDVGASLGLGAGVKFDVSVDPSEVVESLLGQDVEKTLTAPRNHELI